METMELLAHRFISVLQSVNFGILVESEHRNIILVNDTFLTMFGITIPMEQFMQVDCESAIQGAKKKFVDEAGFIDGIHTALERQEKELDVLLQMKDGRFFQRDYYPVFLENTYRGHAWVYKDVTQAQRLQQELMQVAITDNLTKLYNRHKIHEELHRLRRHSIRYDRPLSVVMIDVDDFKRINDSHGHHTGDTVLRAIAQTMQRVMRSVDILGRWGGEEFLILLPETSRENATTLIERFRVEVSSLQVKEIDRALTISAGLTTFDGTESEETLVSRADTLLYKAKAAGKNRVESA